MSLVENIAANIDNGHYRLQDCAAKLKMPSRSLQRELEVVYGLTFSDVLRYWRLMSTAKFVLVDHNENPLEVLEALHFKDRSCLNLFSKREFGTTYKRIFTMSARSFKKCFQFTNPELRKLAERKLKQLRI